MALHIGIDGSCLTAKRAGIGFYLSRLLKALDSLPGDERYTVYSNKILPDLGLSGRFSSDVIPIPSTTLWAQTLLRLQLHNRPVDLFHTASIGMPLWYRGKGIITVHDLAFAHFPEHKDWATRLLWNYTVPRLIRQSTHVLANSEFTKADIIRTLGIEPLKITATLLAADPAFVPIEVPDEIRWFRKQNNLERDYILCVGTLEPRKNIPFLLRAYANCARKGHIDGDLVLIGKKGWLYESIFATERELGLGDRIRFIGYVESNEELRRYYCGSRFFVFPSLFEGFGFPPLEAMSCGTAVICSDRGSLPEVVGDGGLLLDPCDSSAWENRMAEWWKRGDLPEWREKALARAGQFSWKRTAEQTLEVYRGIGGK
ncbi:MAG TPA: glycosyltransferase family 1 protein [bacterium]|nr:glycosyltransferase family 1 protein [bacterium]HQL63336.1 glycosyltransferase family 1 protein [bacterium]